MVVEKHVAPLRSETHVLSQWQNPISRALRKAGPLYAKMLQQALGGIEGEMRVCLQYLFQA